METTRIFMGYTKADGLPMNLLKEKLLEHMKKMDARVKKERAVEIVLGHEDNAKFMSAAGGWDAWARDVVTRTTPAGTPYYGVIIVAVPPGTQTSTTAGKATGITCGEAIKAGRKLYTWDGETLTPIVRAFDSCPTNYKRGWALQLGA